MKLSLLLLVSLFSTLCVAQNKKFSKNVVLPELSLREKALAESAWTSSAKTAASATDAQVPGMLTLRDPRPEVITRSWNYFVGFSAQSFQAEGLAKNEGSGSFDLSKNGNTFMPGIELGMISSSWQNGPMLWKLGLRGKAGFSSQDTAVTLDSGYVIDDARLNTTLFGGGLLMAVQWENLPHFSFTFSPQLGNVIYTQTSANDFATFSKQAGFHSLGYGLDWAFSSKWSLFTEWTQRHLQDSGDIALQKDNFELGTKVTW